jgi:hypothetical protein
MAEQAMIENKRIGELEEALRDLVTTLDNVLPADDFFYERQRARATLTKGDTDHDDR